MLIRLDKYLADAGIGSRSQVKTDIKKGKVKVNQQTVLTSDYKVNDARDEVEVDGVRITLRGQVYYMLNKPEGVVTATEDNHDRTVIDLMAEQGIRTKDLFPVGRLDKDTHGLLLITNDGILAHELLSPKKHVEKTYYVKTAGPVTEEAAEALQNGVNIGEKEFTMPASVQIISETEIELTIMEGKFHQVKRMLQAVDNEVLFLKRIRMGSLILDESLAEGNCRALTAREIAELKKGKQVRE